MPRRLWTDAEIETVRRLYPTSPVGPIAKRLRRSVGAVHQMAAKLGANKYKHTLADATFLGRLREMHANGCCDPEVATALGCERHTISLWRRRMGLPANKGSERYRRAVSVKTQTQLDELGLKNLGQLRSEVFRASSRVRGWPDGLRKRHADILDALAERGPMSREEIAEAIGAPWPGTRSALKSRDPGGTYLALLMSLGLVVSLGRIQKLGGKGRNRQVYALSLDYQRAET